MPNNVKVLLVDDNPMVLGMLRGALTPLAIVTTANDAADALVKAWKTLPTCWCVTIECRGWMAVNWWKS